jgi:hypothetical protein
MSMIEIDGPGDGALHITGWEDSNSIAVITWRSDTGGTQQQELTNERQAVQLLHSISADDGLTLISAQLRRAGTGPAS